MPRWYRSDFVDVAVRRCIIFRTEVKQRNLTQDFIDWLAVSGLAITLGPIGTVPFALCKIL